MHLLTLTAHFLQVHPLICSSIPVATFHRWIWGGLVWLFLRITRLGDTTGNRLSLRFALDYGPREPLRAKRQLLRRTQPRPKGRGD